MLQIVGDVYDRYVAEVTAVGRLIRGTAILLIILMQSLAIFDQLNLFKLIFKSSSKYTVLLLVEKIMAEASGKIF